MSSYQRIKSVILLVSHERFISNIMDDIIIIIIIIVIGNIIITTIEQLVEGKEGRNEARKEIKK